jgi:hypothetical protein
VISRLKDFAIYESYIQWIKDSIEEDLPWDQFTRRLIEAEGTIFEDPASGWYLRDFGMPLNNFSTTISTFLGTEITCAQCHDHPFEEWTQMDYYQLASFIGQREDSIRDREYNKAFNENRKRIEEEVRKVRNETDTYFDPGIRQILGFNRWSVNDQPKKQLKLPGDYKYEDAKPGMVVPARTIFGEDTAPDAAESPRKAFAQWIASKENPRFSVNIANRVWDQAFGLPLQSPVDNLSDLKRGQNPELLEYLGETLEGLDFSLKELRRVIYYSQSWQREATAAGATEEEVGKNKYPFPGPILRRLTAEQLWDSYLTLLISNPLDLKRDVADDYRSVLEMDVTKVTGREAVAKIEGARKLVSKTIGKNAPSAAAFKEGEKGMAYRDNGDVLHKWNNYYVRASEMRQPANSKHFLASWGQADREASDNGSTQGSVPQILHMLNGSLTHMLAQKDSMIFKKAGGQRATGDKLDQIYLSILSRPAEGSEKAICYKAIRADESGYADLIWALINTREFLFIQ